MKLSKFGLIVIVIYSFIIYEINITIGLYAGLPALVFLIIILPVIVPGERRISKSEEQMFGKMEIKHGDK